MEALLRFILIPLLVALLSQESPGYEGNGKYEAIPPFLLGEVKPNVLIILDNSNSMDEDFYGEAVGSYSPASKSVVARKVLRTLIDKYKDRLRIGLMTYRLPSRVRRYHLHNSPYFVSYDPRSYCPKPKKVCYENPSVECNGDDDCPSGPCVDSCVAYCQTERTNFKTACLNGCRRGNPLFDPDYFADEIINAYPLGSSTRNKYCELIYPKVKRLRNPTDPSNYVYYKHAYPFYSGSSQGTGFAYSTSYDPREGSPYDVYRFYDEKRGTSDGFSGYYGYQGRSRLYPTDTDIALGYLDFGRRLMWYHVGRTWFSNSSPGDGYLHVPVDDLIDEYGNTTPTYQELWKKLDPKEKDESGYMSCSKSDKNRCSYIINAGLTPTAGTFRTAIDYFKGSSSPIEYRCQKNFIVYVTDGLPSVDESGHKKSADELMPQVLNRIDQLRNLTVEIDGDEYTFDVKTYIVGVGLSEKAKEKLDEMARHGGTDVDGHAYYADNPDEFYRALAEIFERIEAASGTSSCMLSAKSKKGSLSLQATFFPNRKLSGNTVSWIGYLYAWWLYATRNVQNLREDTDIDKYLEVLDDLILQWRVEESTGELFIDTYSSNSDGTPKDLVATYTSFDELHPLWEAGQKLLETDETERRVFTVSKENQLVEFTKSNLNSFSDYLGSEFPPCISSPDDLVDYIRGRDIPGCRSRTDGSGKVWKLGDIVYSSPTIVDYGDYSVAFVGANDGMLHAFKVGYVKSVGSSGKVARLQNEKDSPGTSELGKELWAFIPKNALPYLRYLADPDYRHMYLVDLQPFILNLDDGRKILIGGMRLGGGTVCENEVSSKYCKENYGYVFPPSDTCPNPEDRDEECIGLSSYFAIDITDPENPQFMWEFTDRNLGLSFSGPGIVKAKVWDDENDRYVDKYYVVFGEGPDTPKARVARKDDKLYYFVLDLNSGQLLRTFSLDKGKSFSGRLFNWGLDYDQDGYSDYLFVGYSRLRNGKWQGGIVAFNVKGGKPENWSYTTYLDGEINPVVSRVIYGDCFVSYFSSHQRDFDNKIIRYIYFGTGKWFWKEDDATTYSVNYIYGLPLKCDSSGCDLITEHVYEEPGRVCSSVVNNHEMAGWRIELEPSYGEYLKEKALSDPLFLKDNNAVLFGTAMPSGDVCSVGGKSRYWMLNCALGSGVDFSCPSVPPGEKLKSSPLKGTVFVQLSNTRILQLREGSFSENEGRSTNWYQGIVPEAPPTVVAPGGGVRVGELLLWLER
ncbi:pilus assembly protein [Thermovibrio sp.]